MKDNRFFLVLLTICILLSVVSFAQSPPPPPATPGSGGEDVPPEPPAPGVTQTYGNGIIEGTEQCDGSNLNGKTCVTQGFSSGTLSCTSPGTFVTSSCTILCSSFTYSAWGACQPSNNQARTVTSSSPSSCTGGSPVLSQSCTYVPTPTSSSTSTPSSSSSSSSSSSGSSSSGSSSSVSLPKTNTTLNKTNTTQQTTTTATQTPAPVSQVTKSTAPQTSQPQDSKPLTRTITLPPKEETASSNNLLYLAISAGTLVVVGGASFAVLKMKKPSVQPGVQQINPQVMQLKSYIQNTLAQGYSKEQIIQTLSQSGYSQQQIAEAMQYVR